MYIDIEISSGELGFIRLLLPFTEQQFLDEREILN